MKQMFSLKLWREITLSHTFLKPYTISTTVILPCGNANTRTYHVAISSGVYEILGSACPLQLKFKFIFKVILQPNIILLSLLALIECHR